MRLFVAIEIPEPLRGRLAGLDPELEQLRWMRSFHLTLAFLGEMDDPAPFKRELGGIVHPRFSLTLGGLACFGGRRGRPLGLWLEVGDPTGSLAVLRERVVAAAGAAGLAVRGSRFHPHVTVARGRRGLDRAALRPLLEAHRDAELGGFEAGSFALFSSTLGPSGAEHRVELDCRLGG